MVLDICHIQISVDSTENKPITLLGWWLTCFCALKSIIFTAYGREGVKMNFIDRIFIGELTSTVMCEECANVGNFGIHFNME